MKKILEATGNGMGKLSKKDKAGMGILVAGNYISRMFKVIVIGLMK